MKNRLCLLLSFVALFLSPARAQEVWVGGTDQYWTQNANWQDATAPVSGADVVFDFNALSYNTDLGTNFTLNGLTISTVFQPITISNFVLTLGAGGLDMSAAAQNARIQSRVNLEAAQSWTVVAGMQLTQSGRVEGPGSLLKLGAGMLSVGADGSANVYSGSVTVAQGTLSIATPANQPPFGTAANGQRTVTVLSNAVLTAADGSHNPLGTQSSGILNLVISNGTFNAPQYCHISNVTMWAGLIATPGAPVDGVDFRAGSLLLTRASDDPAQITARGNIRAVTHVDVEDGAAPIDLLWSGQLGGNNQSLIKTNAGTLQISGTADNASLGLRNEQGKTVLAKTSGATVHALGLDLTLNGGEVELAGSGGDQLYLNQTTTVNGGILDLNGTSEGINALNGAGGEILNDALATVSVLTLGQNNGSGTFQGALRDGAGQLRLGKSGTGTQVLTGTNTLGGGTSVSGGVLQVNGLLNGDTTTVSGAGLLGGTGSVAGVSLAAGGRITGGLPGTPGTLSITGNLSAVAGATNVFDLFGASTIGGGVNDLLVVGGNLDPQGTVIRPVIMAVPPLAGYRLFNYAGGLLSGFTPAVTNVGRYGLTLDTSTVGQVNLLVSGTNKNLRWNGTASTAWDLNTTANWFDRDALTPGATFYDLDSVLFDDTPALTTTVTVTGTLVPSAVTVATDTNIFTFTGAGKLTGSMGLTKSGTNRFTLGNSGGNDFTGGITLSNGVLALGHATALPISGVLTVAPTATFDFAGQGTATTRAYTFAIAGDGVGGQGAMNNSGAAVFGNASVSNLTLLADASVGAVNRWDVGTGSTGLRMLGNGFAVSKVGAGEITFRPEFVSNVARMVISAGRWKHETFSQTSDATLSTTNIVLSGATLASHGTLTLNYPVEFLGGQFNNDNGIATWTGPIALLSNTTMNLGNQVNLSGVISGLGTLIKSGAALLVLSNANSFGGLQIINGGGEVHASSLAGSALAGRVTLGSGPTVAGTAVLRTFRDNQFGPGVVVTNRGSWNDWSYLILMGTTQTVAGLADESGAGVLEATETENGIGSDALLIINGSGTYSCNSFTRDRSGGTSTSKLRILMTGSGTQTLAGSNRSGQPDFSGGLIVSNGWINLKSHRAAGSGLIELAGGGLALDGSGLAEDRSAANVWNTTFINDYEAVVHYPYFAGDPVDGDAAGPTWCYTGYFNVTNATPVTWTFAEQYDDNAYLKVDGEVLLNNTTWNVPTIATRTLQPGLHAIEFRVHSTDTGIGPNNGWTNGIGYDAEGRNTATATNFVPFLDPGDGSFLQTLVQVTNAIQLRANAALKVSSAWGPTNLITSALTESGGSYGLTKVGAGALWLTAPTQQFTGPVTVEAGKLLVAGDLGSVTVTAQTGAVIGGSPLAGAVVVHHLGGMDVVDPAAGENNFVATSLTIGDDADSTTRVSVVLGAQTNILDVTGAGGLTVNGKVIIDVAAIGPMYGGVYDVIRYDGALGGSIANFELGNVGFNVLLGPVTLQDSGSAIQLVVPAATAYLWDGTPLNWWDVLGFTSWVGYPGGPGIAFEDGFPVLFEDSAQNFTVDIEAQVGPSSLRVIAETNDYVFTGPNAITGAVGLVKSGAGKLTIQNTNTFTGPLVISNGLVSVNSLANGGLPSQIGAQGTAASNLVINGGTLRYTGPSATINRMFTVGTNGGVVDVATAGQNLKISGAGWNLAGTLRKRGAGTLSFAGWNYSYAGAALDVIVEEGAVNYDTDYWWNYPTTDGMRLQVTNGATLNFLGSAPFGFLAFPTDGNLQQLIIERGSTVTQSGSLTIQGGTYAGDGRIVLRGGRLTGGQVENLSGYLVAVKASDTNSYLSTGLNINGNTCGTAISLDVEDGSANPDLIQETYIGGCVGALTRSGAGRWLLRGVAYNSGAINLNGGITQVGDALLGGSLNTGGGPVNNAATLVFGSATANTEGRVFTGTGTVIQAGTGITTLIATNTYTGPTIISGGTLRVNGSLSAASAVTVTPAGTLGGSGIVSGTVALAGAVAPGASVGTLTTGNETWEGGSAFRFEVSDLAGTFGAHPGWDRLQVVGDLNINATAASQMTVRVSSVNGVGGGAPPANLAANSSYTMAFARVTGTIGGFNQAAFSVVMDTFISAFTVTNRWVEQSGNDLLLVLQTGGAADPLIWDIDPAQPGAQDGDGVWDLVLTNWLAAGANQAWVPGAAARLGADTNSGGFYTVNITGGTMQAFSLLFPAGSDYAVTGGTLEVLGGTIAVSNSGVTVSSLLGGSGFTKTGTGTLTLARTAGVNPTLTGPLVVGEGKLVAAGFGGDAVIRNTVTVKPGAVFQTVNSHIIVNSVALNPEPGGLVDLGSQSEVVGHLTGGGTITNSGGQLDLDYLASGQNYLFWGSLVGDKGLFLNNDQVRGGTQWLNGTNVLAWLSMEGPDVLRFSSNGTTVIAGNLAVNTGGGYDGAVVIVDEGHNLTTWRLETQNSANHNAQFYQYGGRVTVTDTTLEEGPARIGHFGGNEVSTYWLNGGSLVITNAGTYRKLSLGIDGYGFFNQSGGTAMVGQLSLNERGGSGGGFFALSNGVFNVGSGGITTEGGEYRVTFAGGTLAAWATFPVNVTSTLTGANGDLRVNADGFSINWNGAIDGLGGILVDGPGGTLHFPGAKAYQGPTTVTNGQLLVTGSIGTNTVNVGPLGTLAGTGVVNGPVTSMGSVVPGWGNIATFRLANGYVQSTGGTMAVEFGLGSNDVLAVTGTATLGGQLTGTAVAYTPVFGASWTVLTATAVSGTFATTNLPSLPPTNAWAVTYNPDSVVLSVVAGGPLLTPYEQWAQSITNPALRGDQEDPDGDGYPNLLEYSQGSSGTNSSDNAKLLLVRTNGQMVAVFNRVNTATDVVYEVQGAYAPTNGAEWTGLATNLIGSWGSSTNVNDDNTATIHRVWVSDLLLGTNRSLRLRVVRP